MLFIRSWHRGSFLFSKQQKTGAVCLILSSGLRAKSLCTFFCLCKRKNQRKAHRQCYPAIAGRLDLALVLLLTELNNSFHLHNQNLKDEDHPSCLIVNSKGAVFRSCSL